MKKHRFVILSLVAFILWMNPTGCHKEEILEPTVSSGFVGVDLTGSINVPTGSGLSPVDLTINTGVFSQTHPTPDGRISIKANPGATQLVSAITQVGDPVLLSIIPDAREGTSVSLDSHSTAEALIFLHPVVVVSEPSLSRQIIAIIHSLPETQTLSNTIDASLRVNSRALVVGDSSIAHALGEAVNKVVVTIGNLTPSSDESSISRDQLNLYQQKKHYRDGIAKDLANSPINVLDLLITPNSPQSGVSVSAMPTSGDHYTITVSNSKKRYVSVYLDDASSGAAIASALLPSRKSLLSFSPLSPSSKDLNNPLDVNAHPHSTLSAYGLGAQGFSNTSSWQVRIVSPVVLTGISDFILPIMQVISGANLGGTGYIESPGGVWVEMASGLAADPKFTGSLTLAIGTGDYKGAILTTIKAGLGYFVTNPVLFIRLLRDGGLSFFESIATNAVLPLRIISLFATAFDLTSAVIDFAQCAMLVTFDIQVPLTVTTTSITGITSSSATGGGNVTSQGSASVTARGVCWSTSQNPTTANSKTVDGSGTGSFTSSITGLSASTTYYVRAYATNSAGTSYGSQVSFTTSGTNPVVDIGLSNFTVSFATSPVHVGNKPTAASFTIRNYGPDNMTSPNTSCQASFYISTSSTFNVSSAKLIGTNGYDFQIASGVAYDVALSSTGLSYLQIPSGTATGTYYTYIQIKHTSPSKNTDPNSANDVARGPQITIN